MFIPEISASKVAGLIGLNSYARPHEVMYEVLKKDKLIKARISDLERALGYRPFADVLHEILKEQDVKECVRNAIQRCRHESVENILPEVEQTAGLILSLRHAEFAEPLKEMLVHEIRGQISKHRGITNEKAILDGYEVAREVKVVERNVRNIKKEYGKFRLIGRIDGFVESENRIVDSKERTRFWESVPIYDEIQMRCYMNMMGAAEAELIERFPNGDTRHTKFTNDPAKWAIIQEAITKAVAEMNTFLLSDENLKRMISKVCVQCSNSNGGATAARSSKQVQDTERVNL
jgi:hypothetical protein